MESCSSFNNLTQNINAFNQILPRYSDLGSISRLSADDFVNCSYLFEQIIKQIDINAVECLNSRDVTGLNQNYKITDELKKGLHLPGSILCDVYDSIATINTEENEKFKSTILDIRQHLETMFTQLVTLENKWKPAFIQQQNQQSPVIQAERTSPPKKSVPLNNADHSEETSLNKNISQLNNLLQQCNDIKKIGSIAFSNGFFNTSNDLVSLILSQVHILFENSMGSGNVDQHNEIYSIADPIKRSLLAAINALNPMSTSFPIHREIIEDFRHHLLILRTQILSQQDEWESAFSKKYLTVENNPVAPIAPDTPNYPLAQKEIALQSDVDDFFELLSRCNEISTFPRKEFDLFISERLPRILKQIQINTSENIKSNNRQAIIEKKNLIIKLKEKIQETSTTLTDLFNFTPNVTTNQRMEVIVLECKFKQAFEDFGTLEDSLAQQLLQQPPSDNQSLNIPIITSSLPQIQMQMTQPPGSFKPTRSNNPNFIELHKKVDEFVYLLSRCNDIQTFPHADYNEFIRDHLPLILAQADSNATEIINANSHPDKDPEFIENADIATQLKVKVQETREILRELSGFSNSQPSDALIYVLKEFDVLYEKIETMQRDWMIEVAKKILPNLHQLPLTLTQNQPIYQPNLLPQHSVEMQNGEIKSFSIPIGPGVVLSGRKRSYVDYEPNINTKKLKITPPLQKSSIFAKKISSLENSTPASAAIHALVVSPGIRNSLLGINLDSILDCGQFNFAATLKELMIEYTNPSSTDDSIQTKMSAFELALKQVRGTAGNNTQDQDVSECIEGILDLLRRRLQLCDSSSFAMAALQQEKIHLEQKAINSITDLPTHLILPLENQIKDQIPNFNDLLMDYFKNTTNSKCIVGPPPSLIPVQLNRLFQIDEIMSEANGNENGAANQPIGVKKRNDVAIKLKSSEIYDLSEVFLTTPHPGKYRICAAIIHADESSTGLFTTIVRNSGNAHEWNCCFQGTIDKIEGKEVESKLEKATWFFLERVMTGTFNFKSKIDGSWFWHTVDVVVGPQCQEHYTPLQLD